MMFRRNRVLLSFFLLVALVLVTTSATVRADGECGSAEECPNPDVEPAKEPSVKVTEESEVATTAADAEDPNCPSRAYVIRCAGAYLDTDKNGKLERHELEAAIAKLPWYARGILQILGSVDKMMKKCDIDGDDAISMDFDMEHNKDQCLATCFKRRAFKSAFFPDCQ